MTNPPKIVQFSERTYRALLRMYPVGHRRAYAELMAQLFHDQCRDAYREGRSTGMLKLWLRVLPDLGKTSLLEQMNSIERNTPMNLIQAKHTPTFLLAIALAAGIVSTQFIPSSTATLLMGVSSVAMVAKALVELMRPSREWLWMAVRTFILMFIYGILMPLMAKLNGHRDPGAVGMLMVTCLFANPLVTLIKLGQFLVERKRG